MATAELAVVLPVLVLVVALAVTAIRAGIDQIRLVDAARLAARSLARGDPPGQAVALAGRGAPEGARVSVEFTGAPAGVTVVVESRAGGLGGLLPSWQLSARAWTPVERPP